MHYSSLFTSKQGDGTVNASNIQNKMESGRSGGTSRGGSSSRSRGRGRKSHTTAADSLMFLPPSSSSSSSSSSSTSTPRLSRHHQPSRLLAPTSTAAESFLLPSSRLLTVPCSLSSSSHDFDISHTTTTTTLPIAPGGVDFDLFAPLPFIRHTIPCDSLQTIADPLHRPAPTAPATATSVSTTASSKPTSSSFNVSVLTKSDQTACAPTTTSTKKKRMRTAVSSDIIFQQSSSIKEDTSLSLLPRPTTAPPLTSSTSKNNNQKQVKKKRLSTTSVIIRPVAHDDTDEGDSSGGRTKEIIPPSSIFEVQDCNITLRNSHADMITYLSAYMKPASMHPSLSSTSSITIHDVVMAELPLPLGGKAKHIHANYSRRDNTSTFLVGPDEYSGPVTLIGKGVYGYAVQCNKLIKLSAAADTSRSVSNYSKKRRLLPLQQEETFISSHIPVIMKVDHAHKHLAWEVVIHSKVRVRVRIKINLISY